MVATVYAWLVEHASLASGWFIQQLEQPVTAARLAEVAAAVLSCFGAYVIARHGNTIRSRAGWIAWLASNGLWIAFAVHNGFWAMATMQTYFLWTSFTGFKKTLE